MNAADLAQHLTGIEYPPKFAAGTLLTAKEAGLVIVYGASDDLMEFEGAIHDEVGAYDGGTAYVTPRGLLENDCEDDECPHFARAKKSCATITAVWQPDDMYCWKFETAIPHATFEMVEDGEPYCSGIVFALADVPVTP